ncbi:MAG: GGDEF domain-containing protein [Magnetococcales bacterium]|nr:GGDEF domain-containing protein [Magnetococcales bacterium]
MGVKYDKMDEIIQKIDHFGRLLRDIQRSLRREWSSRKKMSQKLRDAERMMTVFGGVHDALAVADTENQYLNHICDHLFSSGEYAFIWIGFINQNDDRVHPVASAGEGKNYLKNLVITWSEGPLGNGPTGRALRLRRTQMSRYIPNDPSYTPWKNKAKAQRFASSIALPLLYKEELFGAINLYSKDVDSFGDEKVIVLERMANHVAFGLHSLRTTVLHQQEDARSQRSVESRNAISALLETSLRPISLRQQLDTALEIILSISWLSILGKGSIFLVGESGSELDMVAQKNLSAPLLSLCQQIPFGYCLCGRAAQTRKIVFAPSLDHQHDVTFPGIAPHGHYCIPIAIDDRLLGVLNLYVADGHEPDTDEELFFTTIANTLAGIVERKTIEEEISRLARYDTLTSVFNRRTFQEHLEHELAVAQREKRGFALMFLDLDRFKQVNDQYGHGTGDELLRQVVQRLSNTVRKADVIARFGGDEFCILLTTLSNLQDILVVGQKIIATIGQEFDLSGISCQIGVSIGVSLYPSHGNTGEELLEHADQALYAVKKAGRNNILVYSGEMET